MRAITPPTLLAYAAGRAIEATPIEHCFSALPNMDGMHDKNSVIILHLDSYNGFCHIKGFFMLDVSPYEQLIC